MMKTKHRKRKMLSRRSARSVLCILLVVAVFAGLTGFAPCGLTLTGSEWVNSADIDNTKLLPKEFSYLTSMVYYDNHIYVLDRDVPNNEPTIYKINLQGQVVLSWEVGLYQGSHEGLAVDAQGYIYATGSDKDHYHGDRLVSIKKFDTNGNLVNTITEKSPHEFGMPEKIEVDKQGNIWMSCRSGRPHIRKIDQKGNLLDTWEPEFGAWLGMDLALDSNNYVYFSNGYLPNGQTPIQKYSPTGDLIQYIGGDSRYGDSYLYMNKKDQLYLSLYDLGIRKINPNGIVHSTTAHKGEVRDLCTDNNGNIYTLDNHYVYVMREEDNMVPVTSISFTSSSLQMTKDQILQLSANVYPQNATSQYICWYSSNDTVASVYNGKILAKKAGHTIITAKTLNGNKTATCDVYVSSSTDNDAIPEVQYKPLSETETKKFLKFMQNGGIFYDATKSVFFDFMTGKNLSNVYEQKLMAKSFVDAMYKLISIQLKDQEDLMDVSQTRLAKYLNDEYQSYQDVKGISNKFFKEIIGKDLPYGIGVDYMSDFTAYVDTVGGLLNVFKYNDFRYLNAYLKNRKSGLGEYFSIIMSTTAMELGVNARDLNVWAEYIYQVEASLFANPTKIITAKCPVTMSIFDQDNNLIMQLDNQETGAYYNGYGQFYVLKEPGSPDYIKIAKLNSDQYKVILNGTGDGTMDYSIDEVMADGTVESYYYTDIPVDKSTVVFTTSDTSLLPVLDVCTDDDGVIVRETIDLKYKPKHQLTLSYSQFGKASTESLQNMIFEPGTQINLIAEPKEGYRFDKWVSSDGGEFSNPESAQTTFTMPANETTVMATFVLITPHTHVWSDWIVIKDKTCTTDEEKVRICTVCNADENEVIPATGHSGGTANCHAKAVCIVCGSEYGVISSMNHEGGTETRGAAQATYEAKGYTGDTYCLGCNMKIADGTEIPMIVDLSAPTGEIEIKGNSFKSFLHTVTFGLFFKEKVDVTITGADTETGIKSIEYQKVTSEADYDVNGVWIPNEKFSVTPNEKFIIYAKITNGQDMVTIINSVGTVVYSDSTISADVSEFDKQTEIQADIAVTMTLNDNTLKEVKNGTAVLIKGNEYTVNGNVVTLRKEYLASLENGTATITFDFYPMGVVGETVSIANVVISIKGATHIHNWSKAWTTDSNSHWHICSGCAEIKDEAGHNGGTATCHSKAVCSVCDVEYGEVGASNHDGESQIRDVVEATHKTTGYTGDTYCLGCNMKIATGSVIAIVAHNYGDWQKNDAITHKKVCSCGDTITEAHTWDDGEITAPATHTEIGIKTYICTMCSEMKTEPVSKLPAIVEGADGKWIKNSSITLFFRSNADFKDFISVKVNGNILDQANYNVKEGSTIVELKSEYLQTLEAGKYTFLINSTTGIAKTFFTIEQEVIEEKPPTEKEPTKDNPQTGDNLPFIPACALALFSVEAITILTTKKRKNRVFRK